MSTPSTIAIKDAKGFECIYCHFDGYLSYNGVILQEDYQDPEKVKALIALGDISALRSEVIPDANETHDFNDPQDDVVIAYHRDHQEDWEDVKPICCTSIKKIFEKYGSCYLYYYDLEEKTWYTVLSRTKKPILLSKALGR